METIKLDTWTDFKINLNQYLFKTDLFKRGEFIFRGQRNSEWSLTSSFKRWCMSFNLDLIEHEILWKKLFSTFKKYLIDYELIDSSCSENQILALAQHYGLPTKLLDWSESPYVACFFAVSELLYSCGETEYISVYALKNDPEYFETEKVLKIMTVPAIGNIRLRNQNGLFTQQLFEGTSIEESAIFENCDNDSKLFKFVIPVSEVRNAIADLDSMGINHSYLFPGIEGIAYLSMMRTILSLK